VKRVALFSVLALLLYHVAATALFLLPASPIKAAVPVALYSYVHRFFWQDWHFFAPHPGIVTTELRIRCQDQRGQWSEWVDPAEDYIQRAHETRIGPHGKLLYVVSHIPKFLWTSLAPEQRYRCGTGVLACRIDPDIAAANETYRVARAFAGRVCADRAGQSARAELRVLRFSPFPYSKRHEMSVKARYRSEELRFDPFPLHLSEGRVGA
jgi:hypothetical protein